MYTHGISKGHFDTHGISMYMQYYALYIDKRYILCFPMYILCISYVFPCFSQAQHSVYTWMIMVYCITLLVLVHVHHWHSGWHQLFGSSGLPRLHPAPCWLTIWNHCTSNILWYTSISYGNMLMYDAIWCRTTSWHILVYVKIWNVITWYWNIMKLCPCLETNHWVKVCTRMSGYIDASTFHVKVLALYMTVYTLFQKYILS